MNSATQARPSGRRQDPARGVTIAQRPHHQRSSTFQARRLGAPTWLHYRLDLVEGQSDAPRIPPHQLARLHPLGAPRSWDLLVLKPQRPPRIVRLGTALIGAVLGAVAVVSEIAVGWVGTTLVGFGELLALAGHLIDLLGIESDLGGASRALPLLATAVPLIRWSWRAARWGASASRGAR